MRVSEHGLGQARQGHAPPLTGARAPQGAQTSAPQRRESLGEAAALHRVPKREP